MLTLNAKEKNHVIKHEKVQSWLKKEKVQVAFLQETYLNDIEHAKSQWDGVRQVFFSSFKSNSRGVAILIHKYFLFKLEKND